ncbi:MlaD family protein [Nocardia bovistercoris]|uniref:MCE family protein n=1 Tax=Nocardia bovistercoris TaxID=2785916 RepID=A0A931I8A6_9NOCA|nr:MlaD family protein [Nocardia bovistercoris]MBH0776772.1 MCE family protein [Nocardia bovistercoris]
MPAYTLSGAEVGPRRARVIGACAVLLTVAACVVWRVYPESRPDSEIRVELLAETIGAGVEPGTDVRLDGVRVGSVSSITTAGQGRKSISLHLDREQLFGLTDTLSVEYAPGNLFGISTLQLNSNSGGQKLVDGSTVDLTAHTDRVTDATLAALLKSTGTLTDGVLTPKLTELLSQVSRDVEAFTPLFQAIGAMARAYTETRALEPSFLLDQYGSALAGLPPMFTGGLKVLNAANTNEYLSDPKHIEKVDQMWTNVRLKLLPSATSTLRTAETHVAGLMPIIAMLLDEVSGSVSAPARSAEQLTELLARLGVAFDGPALRARVELDTVPGLAAPLAAVLGGAAPTEGR